jgi:hypothetical protein
MNIIFFVIWEGTGPSAPAVVASLLGRTGSLMEDNQAVIEAEREIDAAFEASPLLSLAYNQTVWTLLAVNEDIFLRDHTERPHEEMHAVVDTRINALTHPLRACLKHCQPGKTVVRRAYIAEDYGHAIQWLRDAVHYDQFCTIFPLWHRKRLMLTVEGKRLVVAGSYKDDKTYEAYNRIVRKEGRPAPILDQPSDDLLEQLRARTKTRKTWFRLDFDRHIVAALVDFHREAISRRFTLPDNWSFNAFSLREYREIMLTLQSMMHGWYLVRSMVADEGMVGMGYPSAVWLVEKQDLLQQLCEYTRVPRQSIKAILNLVTFGSNEIRDPDIATQPLVDLGHEQYALSPFVFLNVNIERNLCTLLNQIPAERANYSTLVDMKEAALVEEIREYFVGKGLEFASDDLKTTDLDLAIIDRPNKACLCLELKWFIEPAEIRELGDRTKELKKGVDQAKHLTELFRANNKQLVVSVLKIDQTYDFFSAVGSVNWIGMADVQDPAVPIVKVWDLMAEIRAKDLPHAVKWLRERQYLPKTGQSFTVVPFPIKTGEWSAEWYGITAPARPTSASH